MQLKLVTAVTAIKVRTLMLKLNVNTVYWQMAIGRWQPVAKAGRDERSRDEKLKNMHETTQFATKPRMSHAAE